MYLKKLIWYGKDKDYYFFLQTWSSLGWFDLGQLKI